MVSYDYIRACRTTAIVFNNDAKACYDRVIPSLGLMATEHFGILSSAATCMLAIIFAMHFFVRTAYGVSPTYFATTSNLLILGVLQGSGAAPCIWMCVSNVLFQALTTLTDGFQAHCPRLILYSRRPGEAFVDDADLWLTSDTQSS